MFVGGAVGAISGLFVVSGLPARPSHVEESLGLRAGLRVSSLVRPSLIFGSTAMVAGIVVTFLPAAAPHASGDFVAIALLVQAAAATISRWWAGRYGDRHGTAKLLAPGVLLAVAGALALIIADNPVAMMAGMIAFGGGFGVAQNASLASMFDQVSPSAYGTVSALWNVAYDAGFGMGAAGCGALAAGTGYPIGFAIMAVVMLVSLGALRRTRG